MENRDWKNLILSVGTYHIRKLSPIEVALLIQEAIDEGYSRKEIADRCQLKGSSMLSKFLNLLKLPKDYWHWIDWPERDGEISMTAAAMVAQHDVELQKIILDARLKYRFNKDQIAFLGQRIKRSGKTIDECIQEVVNKRSGSPLLSGILIASYNKESKTFMANKTQYEKDEILKKYIEKEYAGMKIKIKSTQTGFSLITPEINLFNKISSEREKLEIDINEFICNSK